MTSRPSKKAVVIPVKPLELAKSRLSPKLDPSGRRKLALSMALRVIGTSVATGFEVYVVTADEAVAEATTSASALVVADPSEAIEYGSGSPAALNASLRAGAVAALEGGAAEVLIVPADLPHLHTGDLVAAMRRPGRDGVVIAPSFDGEGTNALALPLPLPIMLSFGPSSFQAHISQAFERGLPVRVLRRRGLCFDVDTPSAVESLIESAVGG